MISINTNLIATHTRNNLSKALKNQTDAMQRISSGKRVNSARDDAAGLAIGNRMEANLRSYGQLTRGINYGISLTQVAEGGLEGITQILQRSRELAVQAANGTLSDSDRASLNAEYRQLRDEIDRIATHTQAFGKYPLAPAEVPETEAPGEVKSIKELFDTSGTKLELQPSGIKPFGFIPEGAKNVTITVDGLLGIEDDIQIFTRDGMHILGTPVSGADADYTWVANGIDSPEKVEDVLFTPENGFEAGTPYSSKDPLIYAVEGEDFDAVEGITVTHNGMTFKYTGDGDRFNSDTDALAGTNNGSTDINHTVEKVTIDEAKEPLFLVVTGTGVFDITAEWDAMPGDSPLPPGTPTGSTTEIAVSADYGRELTSTDIEPTPSDSQSLGLSGVELDPREKAIEAMKALDRAMAKVNSYRGGYGSLASRFESTLNSLGKTEINTAEAQSRINDADFAAETFKMTRAGILQQAGTAMLAQANQTPQAALSLLGS